MDEQIQKRLNVIKSYKEFFASENGKNILEDLIKECNFLTHTMSTNQMDLAYNEGKRNVFLYIFRNINVDLATFLKRIEAGQSQGESNE